MDQLSEHYYADRIPGVKIIDGRCVVFGFWLNQQAFAFWVLEWRQFSPMTNREPWGLRDGHPGPLPPHALRDPEGEPLVVCVGWLVGNLFLMLTRTLYSQNSYKATIESAQRLNLNTLPEIVIRIFPGHDEVCVRVRDYGDGMSLRTIAKATSYLYTSSDSYEKQLEGSQRSYQARRSDG